MITGIFFWRPERRSCIFCTGGRRNHAKPTHRHRRTGAAGNRDQRDGQNSDGADPGSGKISLIARGARRKNSRLAAACQLLAYSELTIYEKGQWFMLDEAETLELFTGLRTDFVALSLASYLADLTDATAQAEDTSQLLRLLLNALYALSVLHKPPQLVKPAFELRLMALSGFEPLADGCAVCGRPEPENPVLDAVHGVVCCAACREKGGLAMPLSPAALAPCATCCTARIRSFTASRWIPPPCVSWGRRRRSMSPPSWSAASGRWTTINPFCRKRNLHMTDLFEKSIRTLELPAVLEKLAARRSATPPRSGACA